MRIIELTLPFEQLSKPSELSIIFVVGLDAAFLVLPMRGDAEFGAAVHIAGSDLHLHPLAIGPNHRGMERLVTVGFG